MLKFVCATSSIFFVLLLTITLPMASKAHITLNLGTSNIISSQSQFRIRFSIEGGQPPYTINYFNLPSKCITTQSYLFFPRGDPNQYQQIPFRVRVEDQASNMLEGTIIVITNGFNLFLDNTLYPFQIQLGNQLQLAPGKLESRVQEIILTARKNYYRPYQTIDDIFSQLPKTEDIDQMIEDKNFVAFLKTIGLVQTKSNLNCVQKIAYLSELASRVYQVRFKYQEQLEKINFLQPPPAEQIQSTKLQQIQRKKRQKIKTYQSMLTKYQKGLQTFNFYHLGFEQKLQQIVQLKRQISVLFDQYDKIKEKSEKIRFELSGRLTLQSKQYLQKQLKKLQSQQDLINAKIDELNIKIDDNQMAVEILQDKANPVKQALAVLEIDLQILQEQINDLQFQQASSAMENSNIRDVANIKKSEILINLQIVEQSLPLIQQIIDKQYFECYGVNNTYSNIRPDLSVNIVTPTQFMQYVRNLYQVSISDSYSYPIQPIQLKNTNVLSTVWTQNFGSIYPQSSQTLTNNFSCLSPQQTLFTQNSYVREIKGNIMEVITPQSGVQYLLLGACTRIQVTQLLPKTGTIIFWRGTLNQKNIYDVYFMLVL